MRFRLGRSIGVGFGFALAALRAPPLLAQSAAPPGAGVAVSGNCPEANAVQSLLSTLVPDAGAPPVAAGENQARGAPPATAGPSPSSTTTPRASPPSGGAPPFTAEPGASVTDLGPEYLVAFGARSKIYADPTRDCAERARVAAAFIALAMLPETGAEESAAEQPAAGVRTEARSEPAASPAGEPGGWTNVEAQGAIAIGLPAGVAAPGIVVRAAAGRGALGAHAACGWFFAARAALAAAAGSVLLERLPCAAGATLRFFWLRRRFDTAIDVGFAAAWLRAAGRGFGSSDTGSRGELGARVAVDTALHLAGAESGFFPVAGVELTAYATPYDFDVTPRGVLGRAPLAWAAVTAGVRWGAESRK